MSEPVVSLIPVRAAELKVGTPLRQSIYDWHGNLLLASGCIIESQRQVDDLIESGFVPDSAWGLGTSQPKPVPQEALPKKAGASLNAPAEDSNESGKEVLAGMDEVRWRVGETLYLQAIDNPSVRYTVRLIGFVKGKTVFVTAPSVDGKFEFIRDGQTFVVRAFSGKKAYAFVSATVKSMHTPHPYLLLSYPKEVRCTVVRRGARAPVKIIASVSLGSPERVAAATITDLSVGGASATIKQELGTKGEEGQIKFKVHAADQDEYLNLKMALRSVVPSENGDGFKHGFEFLDVPIHARLILSAFVHQTLAEGE
jgi:hypothetical protein